MEEILAGLVCGLIMGLVFLGAGIAIIFFKPDLPQRIAERLPPNISPHLIMLFYVIATPPLSGLLGALAGLIYRVFSDSFPGTGMGSPNFIYTLAVLLFAIVTLSVFALIRRKSLLLPLVICIAFAGIFGWILPLLAKWVL
ncbi:hypothetical protein ACFLTS_07070 [Chloroflexota bacterium]